MTSLQQARLVMGIFLATQFLDGVLTYWGVSRFGVQLEFNSWLATLMTVIGPGTALVAAKINNYRFLRRIAGYCSFRPLARIFIERIKFQI